ncbi:MAG: zf-HC2 domain-containing protein [Acidobacteriota bacterium]
MKCEVVKKLFPDYLMMETDIETAGKIEDHISECDDCRRELETSGAMWTKLEVLPVEFPGKDLKKNFYAMLDAEIEKETAEKRGFIGGMFSDVFFRKRLFSPAALLLLILSGFMLGIFFTSGKSVAINNGSTFPEDNKTVNIMTSEQAGIVNIINAYEDLRTGSWTESETHSVKKDTADMNMFEVVAEAAFNFTEYFERVLTL